MKVLFSSHMPFIPLIKELKAKGHEVEVLDAAFSQHLNNAGVEDVPAIVNADLATVQKEFITTFRYVMDAVEGLSPKGLFQGDVKKFLNEELVPTIYRPVNDLILMIYALDISAPNFVVLHNDVESLCRLTANWAAARGIPALHVPHSVYFDNEDRGAIGEDIHDLLAVPNVCAAGPYQAQWFQARGAKQVIPTGLPQFDPYAKGVFCESSLARKKLGLDPYKSVVTYASSWSQNTSILGMHDGVEQNYGKILEVARSMPHVQFVIKVYPRGNNFEAHLDLAKKLLDGRENVEVIITPLHLEIVLAATDLLLCYSVSNVLLEGAYVPGVKLATTHGFKNDYEIAQVPLEGQPVEDVANHIDALLRVPATNYQEFRQKYLGFSNGDSTAKILEVILSAV